ncbi:Metallo-hydrolase/oxidoreductase [Marasmius fiardii PR-910]|nr:Metallo-hydrolase/oxidoreductase [Marasmius fiardii PR-910]
MSSLHLHLNPNARKPLLKDQNSPNDAGPALVPKKIHTNPRSSSIETEDTTNASIFFIGTATTVLEFGGLRILTDPNFLHAGDHVHLGPGVTAQRRTNPAVDLHELPSIDFILLSHYHADHFDQLVEDSLNRDFPIITTPHAKGCLDGKEVPFTSVWGLDFWESLMIHVQPGDEGRQVRVKITGMPGKHVPPGPLSAANDLLKAVPPTNGWLLELGYGPGQEAHDSETIQTGYRIYISGDTLFVDELKEIPKRLKDQNINLMLIHLGGTTLPGPRMPLVMVTMDAEQGLKLMQLIDPDVTIPIHYDDYDVFLSPLEDFKGKVDSEDGGKWKERVVYLDRGEGYQFKVK